jgi:cyclopropane-fatty-acyl-phospholipid synthase
VLVRTKAPPEHAARPDPPVSMPAAAPPDLRKTAQNNAVPPRLRRDFDRLVRLVRSRVPHIEGAPSGEGFRLALQGGPAVAFGTEPAVTLVVSGPRAMAALSTMDVNAVGEAYLRGDLHVEGDFPRLLALRSMFRDRHPLLWLYRFVRPLLFGRFRSDEAAIAHHYDEDPEFFLLLLDARHRAYSQAVFERPDEPLEDAVTRKLEFALEAAHIRPGDRVLDVGGGWGSFSEFAGRRGIQVTSLTISGESERFIQGVIDAQGIPCRVLHEHLFAHQPEEPYDAIVNLGVTEHLPDYPGTLKRYESLLKPGGRVYLDASAARRKHDISTFFERHIFRGNGSTVCLHEYLEAVSRSRMEVEYVINDRENYRLTTQRWAENLEANREEIERRWGRAQFRRFQVYLWGCVDGFSRDLIQAYRWGLRKL